MSIERTGNLYERKIDEIGRIVLPEEMRKTLNITFRDTLTVEVIGNSIQLTKISTEELTEK